MTFRRSQRSAIQRLLSNDFLCMEHLWAILLAPERNSEKPIHSLAPLSTMSVGSAFCGAILDPSLRPWKFSSLSFYIPSFGTSSAEDPKWTWRFATMTRSDLLPPSLPFSVCLPISTITNPFLSVESTASCIVWRTCVSVFPDLPVFLRRALLNPTSFRSIFQEQAWQFLNLLRKLKAQLSVLQTET